MRTLNRPMFKMGGSIKEGVMHGIREPYRGGGAALVGNPVYPQTGGREHHNIVYQTGARLAPVASKVFGKVGNIFKGKPLPDKIRKGLALSRAPTTLEKTQQWFKSAPFGQWLGKDPAIKAGISGSGYLGTPLRKGKDILKWGLTTPSGLVTSGIAAKTFWPDGTPKDSDAVTGVMKPGGYPKAKKKGQGIETGSRGDFAKAEREARVNKYLELMGYDRSKKMAVADALIDASKIVSDRGTLDKKNINRELINPIIQATSARFDKPGQIREAVGLMATKAEIEKDISKEKDALANQLTKSRIAVQEATLDQDNLGGDVKAHFLKQGKLPKGDDLATYARMRGIEVAGVPSTTEVDKWMKSNKKDEVDYLKQLKVGPGVYVVSDRILVIDENNNIQSVL